MSEKIGILHLVDSLAPGGAEHVAVLLANNLPQDRYRAYLCASRQAGALQSKIQPHVHFYDLRRKRRFDVLAIIRLAQFTRSEQISLIHAHTTSLFLGVVLCLLNPSLRLVWHDHFGQQEMKSRPAFLYRPFAHRADSVFTVTRELADWSIQALGLDKHRVHYLPNFIGVSPPLDLALQLPGERGWRMVCVANIRLQKDHLTLLRALAQVVKAVPQAHLILVGNDSDAQLAKQARQEIELLGLTSSVSWLGSREDVPSILTQCDIGVLSSVSEGFPVVLLEYGRAGLAVVSTRVGECVEILEDGKAGLLVRPSDPNSLAAVLIHLLKHPVLREGFGKQLSNRVKENYGVEIIMRQIYREYDRII